MLGKRLGVPVALITFDAAGKAFESMKAGATDICFMAIEPVRAAEVHFTAPYVLRGLNLTAVRDDYQR